MIPKIKSLVGKAASLWTPKADKTISMDFKSNEAITVGMEAELQIIDQETLELRDKADELIERLSATSKQFVPELFKSLIEINTTPQSSVLGLSDELEYLIGCANKEAAALGCQLMGNGCHPFMHYSEMGTRTSARYGALLDRNQWLMRRWMVSGMHVHLGMRSASECIRFMMFFEHFIPHMLALSASSPFWQSSDTGLQSCRSIISEALPTSGLIYTIDSWPEMVELVKRLEKSKTIGSLKDLHWDMRPSPGYGTLELRIFDMPTNLMDMLSLTALVHALALWFSEHGDWLTRMPKPAMWLAKENKWRAMRYGLEAEIIEDFEGHTIAIKDDLYKLFARIDDIVQAQNYGKYIDHLKYIMDNGNSCDRQRLVFERTGSLQDVVRHNIQELYKGQPVYPAKEEAPI